MRRRRLQAVLLTTAVLAFPILAVADISGTPTLAVNATLNLDTGAVGTSGGDIVWNGSTIAPQTGVTLFSSPQIPASLYDSITTGDQLAAFSALFSSQPVPVPDPSVPVLIGIHTKGGNYAKLLVTGSTARGTITVKFTTYGATGSGGGGTGTGPTITTVQNNYGLIPPGLPNYGIAPGTLFFIQGSNLANSTTDLLSSAAPGLQTTVNNVTVSVTVGGTTLQCPLYYLSPTQIDAVLPGNTPLGNGTVTVNNNGTTATAFQITVVQSGFGILSYNGSLAAAYDLNYALISPTNAANPNQVIVLWGSGVGADPNNDDKLYPQKQNNLTGIPMQAYVGGVAADIAYRGRSQYPGVDQVVLTIPASAPTGCFVSLAIVSGNIVSNSVTIPIAASGRTCSDPGSAFTPDVLQSLAGKTTIREGFLTVSQSTAIGATGSQTQNTVAGFFQSVSGFANSSGANQVSIGSCLVYNSLASSSSSGTTTGLDAGPSISVNGPAGSLTLPQITIAGQAGLYGTASVPAGFIPAGGGSYTFNNGGGGKDVQGFNATLTLPPTFTWSNAAQIASVTRSQGVTVSWTGGASGTYVSITGESTATVNGKQVTVTFVCEAPLSAGQFAVPPPVLLSLPSGTGSLSVGNYSNLQLFTAGGLDLGILSGGNLTSKSLSYN
jgi:uncharacterized protein (TIGR03437 family)